jgi:two-component system, cell cycle sensor histidine kinase PleC
MRTFGTKWFKHGSLMSEFSDSFGQAISRQKSAIALNAAKVDAELASKAKSEFIANMSHELRTPLNAIIGFSEMLMTYKISDPERVNQYSGYIKHAAEHLLALINGILDVSKIQAGKLSVDAEHCEIEPILESCILIIEAKAKEKDISVKSAIDPLTPALFADPLRTKQILINILGNAVKFTPNRGKVEVQVEPAEPGFVRISVTDTGAGMSPSDIETAMRPFGQVDSGFNKRHEGTGLGLPISVALAKMHGGSLTIESQKGVGTKIIVGLPAFQADSDEAADLPRRAAVLN